MIQCWRCFRNITFQAMHSQMTLLIIKASTKDLRRIQEAVSIVEVELERIGLVINMEKTRILVFQNYPKYLINNPRWQISVERIGNEELEPSEVLKYLGVMNGRRLTFTEHLDYINKKAIGVVNKLYPVFRNMYGYGDTERRIISGCIDSLYYYASTVYSVCLEKKSSVKALRSVERRVNIQMARAYRTVSYWGSTILADRPPLEKKNWQNASI